MKDMLLIIDMQEGFRYKESESIIKNIAVLQEKFAGKIVFSTFVNKKKSLFETQLKWRKMQDKKSQEILSELRSTKNIVIYHEGYTVFNKKLRKYIKDNRIKRVFLCGIYTDVCIMKTAMDLFDENITSFVIKDACNSLHGKRSHKFAIESLKHILGKNHIISTKEAVNK